MKVEIYRVAGQAIVQLEVGEHGIVADVLAHPDSGQAIGVEGSLMEDCQSEGVSLDTLGTFRVNGQVADLNTPVTEGCTLMIIPAVKGGK